MPMPQLQSPTGLSLQRGFIGLHPRLTDLTPGMIQILGQGTKVTTSSIMNTTINEIKFVDSERHKPRAGRKPTQGSARTILDRNRATRDTLTGQLHKYDGDKTGMRYIHSP